MRNNTAFLLIPNHSIFLNRDDIYMEYAEADMLLEIKKHFDQAAIAAFTSNETNSSLSGRIETTQLKSFSLSLLEHSNSPLAKLLNYLSAGISTPAIVAKQSFIYIFSPGHCGAIAALWAIVLRKHYGLYVRGTWLNQKSETSFLWKLIFKNADFIIATGESFRRRLLTYCKNVVNEVPLTHLKPSQVDSSCSANKKSGRLLFVGRLSESKGVLDAIRALAELHNEHKELELLIAGGGIDEEKQAIKQLSEHLGVQDKVQLLGHLSPQELAKAYESTEIFVFPSYYAEGFPRVLYEAMMYSAAIVTCEMPGTEDFLIDGQNCFYCQPKNPSNLAKRIRGLLENKPLTQQIAANARADVEKLYDSFIDESHTQQLLRFLRAGGALND